MNLRFFSQTIQACANTHHLKNELLELLKQGIFAPYANLDLKDEGIYFTFPDGSVQKVLFYQAQIQESLFRLKGDPCVHIIGCKEAKDLFSNAQAQCLAILRPNLRFFLGIYTHKTQTKFFHDKPLKLCGTCLESLSFDFENLEDFLA